MTREHFSELIRKVGAIVPEGLEEHIADLEADEKWFLKKEDLQAVLDANQVPADKQAMLFAALDAVNGVPELVEIAGIMAKDAARALHRCSAIEFFQPKPSCLTGFAVEAFAFLFSQRCILEGRKGLRKRGVPETHDAGIPERMTRKQLKKFVETGDINFDDYPWDINFYSCAIFLLDRFYFIPYRWEDAPEAWRNIHTGAVQAVWKAGDRVRSDGQLDGVNGIFDAVAFETVYTETADVVTANPVSPDGIIQKETVTLSKKEWRKVLKEGDYLLALHIPGGSGYTVERLKNSCALALEFYAKYFTEYNYVGFWSESWLYDIGLVKIIGPERNISRVQRQFYCYPTMEGEKMIRHEVLHDPNADYKKITPKTSLERGVFAAWDAGIHFHTAGMFLLSEEVPLVGADPYWKEG